MAEILKRLLAPADPYLFWLALAATAVGLFMIFDAGYARSIYNDAGMIPREFKGQFIFGAVALFVGALCSKVPFNVWHKNAVRVFLFSAVAVFLTAAPGIGQTMNGAERWIGFGPFRIQPSEFAKIAAILFLAVIYEGHQPFKPRVKRHSTFVQWLDHFFSPKFVRAVPMLLVMVVVLKIEREPDLGTAAVLAAVMMFMLFLGGISRQSILLMLCTLIIGAGFMAYKQPYRLDRIVNHVHRWDAKNVDDIGYQTTQSETAMATGGVFGVGLGSGRAKQMLPAATTDFIMATVAEEFGLIGSAVVILILLGLCFRLVWLSSEARTLARRYILAGTAMLIGFQACINILMANGTLPPIGIPLPFVSSGGSSLIALWIAIGICQSAVAKQPQTEESSVEAGGNRGRYRRARLSRA